MIRGINESQAGLHDMKNNEGDRLFVGLSLAKFPQAESRDAPTLPGSWSWRDLGQSPDTHLPLNPAQNRRREALDT